MAAHFSEESNARGSEGTAVQTTLPPSGVHLDKVNRRLLLRGDIPCSMAEDSYEVYVSIELSDDCKEATKIGEGFCPCVASAVEDCQHVAALIYNAERHADRTRTSFTGKLCYGTAEPALSGSIPDVSIPLSDMVILKQRKRPRDGEEDLPRKRKPGARRSEIYKKTQEKFPYYRRPPEHIVTALFNNFKLAFKKKSVRKPKEKEENDL